MLNWNMRLPALLLIRSIALFCASSPATIQLVLSAIAAPLDIHLFQFFVRQRICFSQGKQHRTNSDRPRNHLMNLIAMPTEHPRILYASLPPKLCSYFSHPITKPRVILPAERPAPKPPQFLEHLGKPRSR